MFSDLIFLYLNYPFSLPQLSFSSRMAQMTSLGSFPWKGISMAFCLNCSHCSYIIMKVVLVFLLSHKTTHSLRAETVSRLPPVPTGKQGQCCRTHGGPDPRCLPVLLHPPAGRRKSQILSWPLRRLGIAEEVGVLKSDRPGFEFCSTSC